MPPLRVRQSPCSNQGHPHIRHCTQLRAQGGHSGPDVLCPQSAQPGSRCSYSSPPPPPSKAQDTAPTTTPHWASASAAWPPPGFQDLEPILSGPVIQPQARLDRAAGCSDLLGHPRASPGRVGPCSEWSHRPPIWEGGADVQGQVPEEERAGVHGWDELSFGLGTGLIHEEAIQGAGGRPGAHLWGTVPFSVTASHHMVKPTLTMVLAMKMRKTMKALTSRFRKA